MIVGYAHVSTEGQTVDAQVKRSRDAGAEKIIRETASGASTDQRELARACVTFANNDKFQRGAVSLWNVERGTPQPIDFPVCGR